MRNEIIKYNANINNENNLKDIYGTLNNIDDLIGYLRDLSRQLVPLVDSLVPLSDNLNDVINNLSKKIEKFFNQNPTLKITAIIGIIMIGGYLTTGTMKNILDIKQGLK